MGASFNNSLGMAKRTTNKKTTTKSTGSTAPSKGRSLSKSQKINIAKKVCTLYATDKYPLMECLKKHGIKSFSTWYKWKAEVEEIEELYKIAIAQKDDHYKTALVQRAKKALEKWVDGYEFVETKIEYEKVGRAFKQSKKVTTKKTKHSLTATMYVLNNFDKANFQRNPAPEKGDDSAGLPFTGFRFVVSKKSKQ